MQTFANGFAAVSEQISFQFKFISTLGKEAEFRPKSQCGYIRE